jgi:hypothetical protein
VHYIERGGKKLLLFQAVKMLFRPSSQLERRGRGRVFNPAISFYCWSEMYPKWRNVTGTWWYPTEHAANNYAPARVNENLTEYL